MRVGEGQGAGPPGGGERTLLGALLPRAAQAVAARPSLRSLSGQLELGAAGRAPAGRVLAALFPPLDRVARAAGEGRPGVISPEELELLDGWLEGEVARWAGRWEVLVAGARGDLGGAARTLLAELAARTLPARIAGLARRLGGGEAAPGPESGERSPGAPAQIPPERAGRLEDLLLAMASRRPVDLAPPRQAPRPASSAAVHGGPEDPPPALPVPAAPGPASAARRHGAALAIAAVLALLLAAALRGC
ncbi:hypothetical protein AMPC_37040 [Anaeromyxobacter paludicola]|uniref:Uncharacterized protein n=2 Tax=Anaeromyxobacter paludicola TaxID=2918171 RepID=A0ABM7XFA5_9BACT|nr:hypothetical protein AMPC_37040 [Anaeromyxobacter paludicola]